MPIEKTEHFRDHLTPWSKCKFLAWWALTLPSKIPALRAWAFKGNFEISLMLRSGGQLFFRNRDDYGVAYEVFIHGVYDLPGQPASLILDLGGHVGFTALLFAWKFPTAKIIVLEPDPARAGQIRRHVQANQLTARVEVIQAAASAHAGRARLSAAGSGSRLGAEGEEVPVVDIFEILQNHHVDILKMDIEGSEFEILRDVRFKSLAPRIITMEWHNTPEYLDGHRECCEVLARLGYDIFSDLRQFSWAGNLAARVTSDAARQQKPT
jgi:FkbM family methyltransferase